MRPNPSMRTWLSPLTGVAFLAIGITGILMLFHVRLPGMTLLHELGGLLFVVVAALHLKVNWRPLLSCCRQRRGRIALWAGTAITAILLVLGLGHDARHERHGGPWSGATVNLERGR
jgi:hypothetical protein